MIGIANFITSTAPAIGPSLGGFLVSVLSWRARCSGCSCRWWLRRLPWAPPAFGSRRRSGAPVARRLRPHHARCRVCQLHLCREQCLVSRDGRAPVCARPVRRGSCRDRAVLPALPCHAGCPAQCARAARPGVCPFRSRVSSSCSSAHWGLRSSSPTTRSCRLASIAFTAGCLLVPGCIAGALQAPLSGIVYDRFGAGLSIIGGCVVTLASTILFFAFAPTLTGPLIVLFFVLYSLGKGGEPAG